MTADLLEITVSDGVLHAEINKPDVLNAIDPDVYVAIDEMLNQAETDPDVSVLMVSGKGRAFSSGFDLKQSAEQTELPVWEQYDWLRTQRATLMRLWNFEKPTIAAVHGHCIGAGFHLMNHFDLVVADEATRFSEPEARYSLLPQPLTVSMAGIRRAKGILFTGDTFSADEAYAMGLVNHVATSGEHVTKAREYANKLTKVPAETLIMTKNILNRTVEMQGFELMHEWAWDQFLLSKIMETGVKREFNDLAKEQGISAAYKWMKERFA